MANEATDHPSAHRSRASEQLRLDGTNMTGRTGHEYLADPDLIAAANVALAYDMPLLLTGEPGCGKTDFAYAVASEIAAREQRSRDEVLFDCPIRSDSRARDLLYVYDAVSRFSDAQLRGREGVVVQADHPARYIRREALGRAFKEPRRTPRTLR